jgi:peptide chain release factor 2
LDKIERKLKRIDSIMARESFWKNQSRAKNVMKRRSQLRPLKEQFEKSKEELEEAFILLELAEEEQDIKTLKEVQAKACALEEALSRMETLHLLGGPHDHRNAIVTIHAGAGGTEAQDWASMLLRMYLRWCENRKYKTQIIDFLEGEEAGIKSVTFTVEGEYAYGYLKSEIGIHRLVRISPFDASGRRHTSFAAVFVYPEIEEDIVIEIKEDDLRIDTFRASGAGGQHVNKTSSAVRITHLPTGIVVQCQNERSQHRNKELAMKVLKARLYELEEKKKAEERNKLAKEKKEIAWGSQIRSYILQPYRLVKDHRTEVEVGNVDAVLDGDLDGFMKAFLVSPWVN